jgi:hypothetical protein
MVSGTKAAGKAKGRFRLTAENKKTTMMLHKRFVASSLLAVAMSLGAGTAHAGYQTYFGEDLNNSELEPLKTTPKSDQARESFLSRMGKVGTETFEKQETGVAAPLKLSFPGSAGALTATLSGGQGKVGFVDSGKTNGVGRYSVPSPTTNKFWDVAAGTGAASTFDVTFDRKIAAFGFYGVDIGDFGGQLELLLYANEVELAGQLLIANTQGEDGITGGSVLFFGLIAEKESDLFKRVRFQMTNLFEFDVDVFAFDNFTIAERGQVDPPGPVPEPGTLALLSVALLALANASRRTAS